MTVNIRNITKAVNNPEDTRYTGFGYATYNTEQQLSKITSIYPMKAELAGSPIISLLGQSDRKVGTTKYYAFMNIADSVDLITSEGYQALYPT